MVLAAAVSGPSHGPLIHCLLPTSVSLAPGGGHQIQQHSWQTAHPGVICSLHSDYDGLASGECYWYTGAHVATTMHAQQCSQNLHGICQSQSTAASGCAHMEVTLLAPGQIGWWGVTRYSN